MVSDDTGVEKQNKYTHTHTLVITEIYWFYGLFIMVESLLLYTRTDLAGK